LVREFTSSPVFLLHWTAEPRYIRGTVLQGWPARRSQLRPYEGFLVR